MSRTSHSLVPFVLCTVGLITLCLCGCKKEADVPASPAVPPHVPESYLNDKAFMDKLDALKAEQTEVMKKHRRAVADYKKALESDAKGEKPATQALKKESEDLVKQYKELRQKMLATVRERITPRDTAPAQQK